MNLAIGTPREVWRHLGVQRRLDETVQSIAVRLRCTEGQVYTMAIGLFAAFVLVVFGAGKLPQLGEGLGKAIKGFKKSVHEPEPQLESQAVPAASAAVSMAAPGTPDAGKAPSHT